jgi:hypothetical protein
VYLSSPLSQYLIILCQPKKLDLNLLEEVWRFEFFCGLLYNHNTVDAPDMLFLVVYHNGNRGMVRGGSLIYGKPRSIQDLFSLHVKICEAKELEPWELLLSKQIKKDEILRIVRPDLFG